MRRLLHEIGRNVQRLRERPQRVAERRQRKILHERLLVHFGAAGGLTVRSGPFAGMQYVAEASWVGFFPRLLGIYEEELHGVVERAIAAGPVRVVDIGSAEGYYAIGLARRLPGARVHAFDIDTNARRLCAEMAARNGVADRVSVGGRCGWDELDALAAPGTLLVSDCEGGELLVLDPARVPGLRDCTILVEIHESSENSVADVLRRRFEATHRITMITTTVREPSRYAVLDGLSAAEKELAVEEFRGGPMEWAYMEPIGPATRPT
jgi:hypothetical protein